MTEHLRFWTRFENIDPQFTKPITGKAYKGTSPSPQYVIKCLTELFGPVGEGFGWEVVAEDFMPLNEEVLHWCRIRFWHGQRSNYFDSYGQTKAVMKTKNGFMTDEDAPKKSLTDAITKAASQIGIAANIFLGRWDDSKYVQGVNDQYREAERPKMLEAIVTAIEEAQTADDLKAIWEGNADLQVLADFKSAVNKRKAGLTKPEAPDTPPADPAAITARILKRIAKASSDDDLKTIWADEKDARVALADAGANDCADKISTAIKERRASFDYSDVPF